MADNKISELPAITGANLADADEFVVVDSSAAQTNSITTTQLRTGLYPGITDIATSETLYLANAYVNFGQAGDPFTIRRNVTDQNIYISGGTSTSNGANLLLYGDDHSFGPEARLRRGSLDGYILDGATGNHIFYNDSDVEFVRFDAVNERIGIGTSVADDALHVVDSVRIESAFPTLRFEETDTTNQNYQIRLESGKIRFQTNNDAFSSASDKLIIDQDGNVGIGYISPSYTLDTYGAVASRGSGAGNAAFVLQEVGNNPWYLMQFTGGAFSISYNGTSSGASMLAIDSVGKVGINDASPDRHLHVNGGTENVIAKFESTDTACGVEFTDSTGTVTLETRNDFRFKIDTSIDMQLDNSGTLLLGKTSSSTSVDGAAIFANGTGTFTRGGAAALDLNRNNSSGTIINLRQANGTIGTIGNAGGYLAIIGGSDGGTHAGLRFINNASIRPSTNTGGNLDDTLDWGSSASRWDDLWATNGTIQTSDANQKQQINPLTETEITAAKAISKLFKTYKWNSSVETKGDAARIRTGVIAQEVEQVMTDAGLDASKYGFWCSDTWFADANGEEVDEGTEGAVERNLKGVRYPELLSFIGAATEQRLASIEARLDALESI